MLARVFIDFQVSQVHKQSLSSLAMSPDARYLLTAGDRVIKVWDYGMRFDVNSQVRTPGEQCNLSLLPFASVLLDV